MPQSNKRNLSMLMDLYGLTMANGYFMSADCSNIVTFDVFFRKVPDNGGYAIFAGLEQIIEYVENLHFDEEDISYLRSLNLFDERFLGFLHDYHFRGDIYSFAEGTVMYPGEPILTVTAPLIDAQIIETEVLSQINHQSLIATKARRIVRAAHGIPVTDFGARRAHNADAAVYGARAAYIGGVADTATVLAGQLFGIPLSGTMAHSWVMYHESELEAFFDYARLYPDSAVLLVDTFSVLDSGIPNAIRTAKEVLEPMGKRLKGVRLDSGDLAYLSKRVRKMLDDAGLYDCIIIASNSLDEYTITSIIEQGGKIDRFGVGERLITSKSDPVFGAVYKITAAEKSGVCIPKIKISETVEKITNPGRKKVWRIYNDEGKATADLITHSTETVNLSKPYRYIDPVKPWKNLSFENCTAKELLIPAIIGGKHVMKVEKLNDIRNYVEKQLADEIWQEEQRFENPHRHHLDMSPEYYASKMELLNEKQ